MQVRQGSPYLIAPCCVGKIKFSLQIRRDRSGDAIHTPQALAGGSDQEATVSELEKEGMGFINRKLTSSLLQLLVGEPF